MEDMIRGLSPTTMAALLIKYDNHTKKLIGIREDIPFGLLEYIGYEAPETGIEGKHIVTFLAGLMPSGFNSLLEGIRSFKEICDKGGICIPELYDYWEDEFLPTAFQCIKEKVSLQVKKYRKQMCRSHPENVYDNSYYNYIVMKLGDYFENLNVEDYFDRYTDCDMLIRVATLLDNFIDKFHIDWSCTRENVDVSSMEAVEEEVLGYCASLLKTQ